MDQEASKPSDSSPEEEQTATPRGGVEYKFRDAQVPSLEKFYSSQSFPIVHEAVSQGFRVFEFDDFEAMRMGDSKRQPVVILMHRDFPMGRRFLIAQLDDENNAIKDSRGVVWTIVDPSTPSRAEEEAAEEDSVSPGPVSEEEAPNPDKD